MSSLARVVASRARSAAATCGVTCTSLRSIATYNTPIGNVSPRLDVPATIDPPPYAIGVPLPQGLPPQERHSKEQVGYMRESCRLAAEMLEYAGSLIEEGISTDDIDKQVHEAICKRGAYPSPLGYRGFPKSLCASINEVICHGIPDDRVLQRGDVVKLDVSVFLNGHHGDTCRSWIVGGAEAGDEEANNLVSVTKHCLDEAIKTCGPGLPFAAIGTTIEEIVSDAGFSTVRDFSGHGVGRTFHTLPRVVHYKRSNYGEMMPNTTFTIEPMVSVGTHACVLRADQWTIASADGTRAAQFEHTLLVTDDGIEILTAYE